MHSHERAENPNSVLRSKGLVELDGERILLAPHMGVFITWVKHAI